MRRVLSVWLPTFATDLVTRRLKRGVPSGPGDRRSMPYVFLTRAVASREMVVRRCARAGVAGVAEGMDVAHARSMLPPGAMLHTEAHQPYRDSAALHSLASWGVRISPVVAPDPPDGLLIDITGTERLHRGEARVVRSVAKAVLRLGFNVRVAAAPTFGCAWAMARFGERDLACVPPGESRRALEMLPVAALRVDEATVQGLYEIGVTRIGEVAALPRASVAARFDHALLERLDRALGRANERIEPVRPSPPIRSELLFDGPTDRWESIEAAARHVLDEVVDELTKRERGVRRLELSLLRPHVEPQQVEISLSTPSRNAKHLWSLLRSRLERLDMQHNVEGVTLTAWRTARLRHEQMSSAGLGASDEVAALSAWGELLDTLVGRLGAENVVRMEPVESHLPERSFSMRSVMEEPRAGGARAVANAVTSADRPTRLFAVPEPARVMALTPDGPVLGVRWRGRDWRVVSCVGPERIGAEWWRWNGADESANAPPDRDYFAVQTESGRWLWVCRQAGTTRWFVHGEWS